MRNVILDTDIGNDVDDIFALCMLAKTPELNLLGVTTVYGDVALQAKMTRYMLNLLGRIDVPVFPGSAMPLVPKPILRGTHIGGGFPLELHSIQVNPHMSGVEYLIEAANRYMGELEILAIGPLTNIAQAIKHDSHFSEKIKKITIMAGLIDPNSNPTWMEVIRSSNGEYNIACDPDASKIVFSSGLNIDLVPLDCTTKVSFTKKQADLFSRMPFGIGNILENELRTFWAINSQANSNLPDYSNHPHDPLTAIALFDDSFFDWKRGTISIEKKYDIEWMTILNEDSNGTTRVATNVNESIMNDILKRIII